MNKDYRNFLENEVPELLKKLTPETPAKFGLMTPQHMVEHILSSTAYCMKRHGEPENPPTDSQTWFKNFVQNGAIIKYRPSDKTKDDLPELKYASIEEAVAEIPGVIAAFYKQFEEQPDFICYNSFMGELDMNEMELFTYQHFKWHLYQFDLVKEYVPTEV